MYVRACASVYACLFSMYVRASGCLSLSMGIKKLASSPSLKSGASVRDFLAKFNMQKESHHKP
jgi:hypothetical protein